MTTAKKTTTSKPKTAIKPKFGEVGYTFNVKATITEVYSETDPNNYPFTVSLDLSNFDSWDDVDSIYYSTKNSLLKDVCKTDSKLSKQLLEDQIKQTKEQLAKLEAELKGMK